MAKVLNSTILGLALSSAFSLANAQTATPITITTGFNQDVIANGSSATTSTTSGIGGIDAFYDSSYATSHSLSGGTFPAGQTVLGNDGNNYTFAASTANNGLLLNSSALSGTLNFGSAPSPLGTLYLLGTSGNGSSVLNYTLNFSGAIFATGSITFHDWYDPTAAGTITGLGRVNTTTDTYDSAGGNNFSLDSIAISIPVGDQSLTLDSISITYDGVNSSSGSGAVIFAASGAAPAAVPEPGTLALAAVGLGLLAFCRRN